jgi:hypothetical protein
MESSTTFAQAGKAERTFAWIKVLATLYLAATAATLVFVLLARNNEELVDSSVWTHALIVFGFALLLVDIANKAAKGASRSLLRLRIIAVVIPAVSVALILTPGLFPTWMKVEQGVYALLLATVALLAFSREPD